MPDNPRRSRFTPFLSPVALACFLLVAAAGLGADLISKSLSWNHMVERAEILKSSGDIMLFRHDLAEPGETSVYDVVLIPNVLELTAVANQGAALGLGQGRKTLFIFVSLAAVGVLFYFFAHSERRHAYQVVLGLLLAGVLGNLYDRLMYGYVRDMVHIFPGVRWSDLHGSLPGGELFPWVFNLADVFLCIGVPAVLMYGLFAKNDPGNGDAEIAEPAPISHVQ